jgi:hypothetical protein
MISGVGSAQREITIYIHMTDGNTFVQPLPIDHADGVQDFMDWLRNPGKIKVWSWQVPTAGNIHLLHHCHIVSVDVEGFIEPEGRPSRWYEWAWDRITSKIKIRRVLKRYAKRTNRK